MKSAEAFFPSRLLRSRWSSPRAWSLARPVLPRPRCRRHRAPSCQRRIRSLTGLSPSTRNQTPSISRTSRIPRRKESSTTRTWLTWASSRTRSAILTDLAALRGRLLVACVVERRQHVPELLQRPERLHDPACPDAPADQDPPLPVSPRARRDGRLASQRAWPHGQGRPSPSREGHLEEDQERAQPHRVSRVHDPRMASAAPNQARDAANAPSLDLRTGRKEDPLHCRPGALARARAIRLRWLGSPSRPAPERSSRYLAGPRLSEPSRGPFSGGTSPPPSPLPMTCRTSR